jgi:ribose transport system substrate-binding protein
MFRLFQQRKNGRSQRTLRLASAGVALAIALCVASCGSHTKVTIAVIPQTEGNMIWEAAHVGVATGADRTGASIYWNAPTREDDVETQIALVERVTGGHYQGLVLAPDQALSLISPVRSALARGIPTVIIGTPLPIPAGGNLSYILNDDQLGGQLAARRVAGLLHGHGSVAVLGINPDVTGTTIRAHSFEEYLTQNFPSIRIVGRRMGSFNFPHEQQVAEDTLRAHPDLDVIVALMSTSVDGTTAALSTSQALHSIKVIGFDLGGYPSFERNPSLDCVIQEDTRSMGEKAIELIQAHRHGQSAPSLIRLPPAVIDRHNINTPQVQTMLSQDWTLGHTHWSSIR